MDHSGSVLKLACKSYEELVFGKNQFGSAMFVRKEVVGSPRMYIIMLELSYLATRICYLLPRISNYISISEMGTYAFFILRWNMVLSHV